MTGASDEARAAATASGITLLDGPLGTELAARGVAIPEPLWSAWGLIGAPEVVADIHRDYAAAGATVHTAATFRTRRRTAGERWGELTALALRIAREAVPAGDLLAGSLAPLEDCYRPERSPAEPRAEHREMARALAEAGADLILCETFPHVGEALIAVEEAVATGVPVWLALTAGPEADLLTPEELARGAEEAVRRGAAAVLVNCVAASRTAPYVDRLADRVGGRVPFGAYANAGRVDELIGWAAAPGGAASYAELALAWIARGATLVGGCCGTGPAHIAELARAAAASRPSRSSWAARRS